ncbi:MAG: efflux transporter outer membrane subunit [Desulfobacula sp.]|nr:efflux transporter outer membrane subunit [Desulfobacula sp.]
MKQIVFLIILTAVFVVSGCKTIEPEKNQSPVLNLPEKFFIEPDGGETAHVLPLFSGYEELKALINEAFNNNFDLKILNARISQAKAMVAKDESLFFPSLGFSSGGQKNRAQNKNEHGTSSTYSSSHSWDGSLQGSYTVDVWGEAKADKKAQELKLKAAIWDLKESKLVLTTTMAQVWVDIISVRNKQQILLGQIKNNQTLLELQKLRFLNGRANALDVSQQHEAIAQANSQVPLLEKQEHLLINTLVFLSGKNRSDGVGVTTKTLPAIIPLPMTGVPLNLLDNRPDIQAARLRLFSSQWKITAAKADLLPSFNLTAQALFSSGKLDLLFQNWVVTLAGSIAGPVFDGGFRKAEVKRVKALAEEQLNIYAMIVAKAIKEVEDTLVSIQKQASYIKLLEQELEAVRLTLKDARIQYLNGQSSYLNYLIALTGIERLERQLVSERAVYIKDRIMLYKVLGLGFGT